MKIVEAEIRQEAELNSHYSDQNYWKIDHIKDPIDALLADYE